MSSPALGFWRYAASHLMFCIACVLSLWLRLPGPVSLCLLALTCGLLWLGRHPLRLMRRVQRFETRSGARVVFHYAPGCKDTIDLALLQELCTATLDEQAILFGFHLRRRLIVYLFASRKEVAAIHERQTTVGFALVPANAIVIAADTVLAEVIPHEVAHLFAARLNRAASCLFQEGLAVWLQGSSGGVTVDEHARQGLKNKDFTLDSLRRTAFFHGKDRHLHYMVAGSFTGFLIRRFGWLKYRQYYRRSQCKPFKSFFNKSFGLPFAQAESSWRQTLLSRRYGASTWRGRS